MEAARDQIFFIGNPLLDISVDIPDNTMVEKYTLTPGLACLATPEQMPIYDECWNMESRSAIPGGSAMNSARAANWYLNSMNGPQQNKVTYFGAIGTDSKGEVLEKSISDAGITGNFHKETETPTGTCAVLVNKSNAERSLCANLAAACKYSPEHLAANMAQLDKAKLIYSTGFFITSSAPSLMTVAEYATAKDIPFGFNLSAVFLLQFELANVTAALKHADFVFCNEDESAQWAVTQNMPEGSSKVDIAKNLASFEKVGSRPRIAILTNGPSPTIVATAGANGAEATVKEYPVPALGEGQLLDTNGAGDSFVGAFFAEYFLDKSIDQCIQAGTNLSTEVVKRSGCTFPDFSKEGGSFFE